MKISTLLRMVFLAVIMVPVAQAHPGHDGPDFTWDFSAGALHPLTGWDHLLAMVAVGMWTGMLGGKARWAIPATFVGTMTLAALLTPMGAVPSVVEQAMAASVLVLGLAVAFRTRLPVMLAGTLVAAFAAFHGFAHGAEIPAFGNRTSYVVGLACATALLHLAGAGLTYSLSHYEKWIRVLGAGIAVAGAVALVS